MMPRDLSFPPIEIRVGALVQRSVATLYSHLVTRPTGRAVRLAIESQLAEAGDTAFSLIDLSEVTVLDFSCADEVVAKLVARYLEADRPREAYFVIPGSARCTASPSRSCSSANGWPRSRSAPTVASSCWARAATRRIRRGG